MEEPQLQPSITYSYDTLPPLSLSVDYDHPGLSDSLPSLTLTPTGSLSADPDPPVSYAVFRNQINDVAGESMEVPTTEFFSLDVVAAPSVPDVANSPSLAEPECSEKAWFNVGRQFRSPMLQLHKGSFIVLVILFVIWVI